MVPATGLKRLEFQKVLRREAHQALAESRMLSCPDTAAIRTVRTQGRAHKLEFRRGHWPAIQINETKYCAQEPPAVASSEAATEWKETSMHMLNPRVLKRRANPSRRYFLIES